MSRILVVEDEADLAEAVARGLREERHSVDVEHDGHPALAAITSGVYDLVVLDLMLPGIDGLELCRRTRAANQAVPILMLTARDGTADVVLGLDAGANDYLTKPFAFAELLARIRALLRGPTSRTSRLRVGPVVLDLVSQRAFREGAELAVTAKEYQLLEAFMLRPGRILSKARLAEILWSWERDSSENAIEAHISNLRRKLEPGGGPGLIRTVRGRGYVFEDRPA